MKKLISPLLLLAAILLALAFTRLAGSQSAPLCYQEGYPPPYPYPAPAVPCEDAIPSGCHLLVSQSFPPWPWEFPSGKYPICYIKIRDLYGEWGFSRDGCKYGPDGARCVRGMGSSGAKVRVEGPERPDAVDVFVSWLRWLPEVVDK